MLMDLLSYSPAKLTCYHCMPSFWLPSMSTTVLAEMYSQVMSLTPAEVGDADAGNAHSGCSRAR